MPAMNGKVYRARYCVAQSDAELWGTAANNVFVRFIAEDYNAAWIQAENWPHAVKHGWTLVDIMRLDDDFVFAWDA